MHSKRENYRTRSAGSPSSSTASPALAAVGVSMQLSPSRVIQRCACGGDDYVHRWLCTAAAREALTQSPSPGPPTLMHATDNRQQRAPGRLAGTARLGHHPSSTTRQIARRAQAAAARTLVPRAFLPASLGPPDRWCCAIESRGARLKSLTRRGAGFARRIAGRRAGPQAAFLGR